MDEINEQLIRLTAGVKKYVKEIECKLLELTMKEKSLSRYGARISLQRLHEIQKQYAMKR